MAMRLMKTNVASLSDLTRVWGKAGVKKTWVRETITVEEETGG